MNIKVITLWEPWSTLMAIGAKTIETRSRNTKYRGIICIHSGLKKSKELAALCKTWPFKKYIKDYDALPFGKIIGQLDLYATGKIEYIQHNLFKKKEIKNWKVELEFGRYDPGRYGYMTRNPVLFNQPVPAKGSQIILWNFDSSLLPEYNGETKLISLK